MSSIANISDHSSLPQNNDLHGKWDLYYHLPNDKNWDLSSYKYIMKNIQTVEQLIAINEALPEKIVKHCMLFVMRSGITPMWEDVHNRKGGCFSFKVLNKQVPDVWKTLFYAICGESLCIDKNNSLNINGMTVSPKKNFCIIKVWLKDYTIQDPAVLIHIVNLSKQGCLFKKHAPEF
jgi:hypothetical protein